VKYLAGGRLKFSDGAELDRKLNELGWCVCAGFWDKKQL
jgi:hypothetical protein